jgi:hypothetical protein
VHEKIRESGNFLEVGSVIYDGCRRTPVFGTPEFTVICGLRRRDEIKINWEETTWYSVH